MYDTVGITLRAEQVPNINLMSQTPLYIDVKGKHLYGNVLTTKGYLGNLEISITEERLKITKGSLCKWHLGDNFQTLTIEDTKNAIEHLSDTLHLPINKADITHLDFGHNLALKQTPETYFEYLGGLNHARRIAQPSGLYYTNSLRQVVFYDKIKEQKSNHLPIPNSFRGSNLLRYELRHKKDLRREFGKTMVTASDLYDPHFFRQNIEKWFLRYQKIQKLTQLQIDFSQMKTKRNLFLAGAASLVNQFGGVLSFERNIHEAFQRKEITKKEAFHLREGVKESCNSTINTKESEFIAELDLLVNETVEQFG